MANPSPPSPSTGGGSFLTRKVGPLPTRGYLVVAGGVVGFVWWRSRSAGGASSAADSATPGASAAGDSGATPTTDYGQGFDYGYAAGLNATGQTTGTDTSSGTDTAPAAHGGKLCFKATDPSGQVRTVCGMGHWVRRNGQWHWEFGVAKNPAGSGGTGKRRTPRDIHLQRFHGSSAPLATVGQSVPYATV